MSSDGSSSGSPGVNADRDPFIERPKLHLQVLDLGHAGTRIFFDRIRDFPTVFEDLSQRCRKRLYSGQLSHQQRKRIKLEEAMPPIRSVTLFLHEFSGVAYTKRSDLDPEHKELHLSTSYIAGLPDRLGDKGVQNEIKGVLIHELAHVWQRDGNGHVPGWWIEGLADYVRLKEGLAAEHWREYPVGRKYDDSYETTAFFLAWLENSENSDSDYTVSLQNLRFKETASHEDELDWIISPDTMASKWSKYEQNYIEENTSDTDETAPKPIPTHV